MFVGYARVSTEDPNLDLQRRALEDAGCEEIYQDHTSGLSRYRPQLDAALERVQPRDTLIVWRLDRLGRSINYILRLIEWTGQVGIGFCSIAEKINTVAPGGRLVLHVIGALADLDRSLIVERTKVGLEAARRRGATAGRPRKLTRDRLAHARELLDGGESKACVAQLLGVHQATLRRALLAADEL